MNVKAKRNFDKKESFLIIAIDADQGAIASDHQLAQHILKRHLNSTTI